MALDALSTEDKLKLKKIIDDGVRITEEIKDLRGALNDTIKSTGEALNIKPKIIRKAIKTALTDQLSTERDEFDSVIEVLYLTGHIVE